MRVLLLNFSRARGKCSKIVPAFLLALMPSLAMAQSLASQGPTQLKPGFNLFTRQQDIQLGRETAAQIRKHVTIVNDPILTNYVNAVGRRLIAIERGQSQRVPIHL